MEHRNRRSTRLRGYDYGWPGAYFITIVTRERASLFEAEETRAIVQDAWASLPERFPGVALDAFVVMPNHIHGIVVVNEAPHIVGVIHESPIPSSRVERRTMLLGKVMGYFKMNVAKRLNALRGTPGVPVWQKNYYEHVVRGEDDLARIRKYVQNYPLKWAEDELNPAREGEGKGEGGGQGQGQGNS